MFRQKNDLRSRLFLGAAAVATLGFVTSASAQQASDKAIETVVVTGTMVQGNVNLTSPVTVVDQKTLDQRGISTIQDAIQTNVAINGPALTNSFTANGAFASGASGASLRGLTTNSTLVLFDGLRAAYYPLADDGSRNFVDLNTIPDDIVDHIEILRDGASAEYGADAIAGVINVITKRDFTGLSARVEGGISDRGDAGEFKVSATAGMGDLSTDHVNGYISGFYLHEDALMAKDRPYPYDSLDGRGICYLGNCGSNNVINGLQTGDIYALSTAGEFMVAPGVSNPDGSFTRSGNYQNESGDTCAKGGVAHTLTTAEVTGPPAQPVNPGTVVCQYDYEKMNGEISPEQTRYGVSGHGAFEINNTTHGWVEANYMNDDVKAPYAPLPGGLAATAQPGIFYKSFSTAAASGPSNAPGSFVLYLPVYVCPERVNCSTAADRTLNPNNPFAGAGTEARIIGRNWFGPTETQQENNKAYRLAAGLTGTFHDNWTYNIGVTAMHEDLTQQYGGMIYIQHVLDLVNDGTYNFLNPSKNSGAINNYLMPTDVNHASSDEDQAQASVTIPVMKLSGGDLDFSIGVSTAYEAVNAPSANSDAAGPTNRYFAINAFGTAGGRDVNSVYGEINAPILENLTVNAAGRYDTYSSGQSAFSPKLGVRYSPFEELTLKGTWSEGFRIPSFGEANALPTTGYVTNSAAMFNDAFLAQYGCSVLTYNSCDAYIHGSLGETTLASPNLKPENSRSYVFDATLTPVPGLQLTATYYNIIKSHAITAPQFSQGFLAYYQGQPIPPEFTIIPNAPDPANPGATPTIAFIEANLINANTIKTSGFDFGATYDTDLDFAKDWFGSTTHWTSNATATYIQSLNTYFPDGSVDHYAGTLGNFNLTAGSGTPSWRAVWQNTVTSGIWEVTGVLNFFSGYNLSAMDQGTGYRDCGLIGGKGGGGDQPCRVDDAVSFDMNVQAHVTDSTTLYLTVQNITDSMPPLDNVTYGANNYNPVQGGDMIYGRYFKFGVQINY